MPKTYRISDTGKIQVENGSVTELAPDVIWIDAISPTDADLAQFDKIMGFEVPNRHDIAEIELSSRLYKEDDGSLVMVANLLPKSEHKTTPPRPAAFILRGNVLLTIRYAEFFSFERVSQRLPWSNERQTPASIFCRLLEEAVADRADNIELSMRYMEELTSRLFLKPSRINVDDNISDTPELDAALRQIGSMGEAVSNIRESITSLQRVANFAHTYVPEAWLGDQRIVLESIRTDLVALTDEAAFFMNKLSFNLDAVLGMINIDENKIIRLLSVVTLLLSPPTLIAGIYGMNFDVMPELHWPLGYLFSIGLMGLTAIVSIVYLKKKRWM